MKKLYLIFGIVVLITIATSCGSKEGSLPTKEKEQEIDTDSILTNDDRENTTLNSDEVAKWNEILLSEGELNTDLNMDGKKDSIQITYEEKEGSEYIKKFELKINGINQSVIIEDYDASFEKLDFFDFNQDKLYELIIMFDTHGGGGEGTHDIYILWINSDELVLKKLDTMRKNMENDNTPYNIDDIYAIEKESYKGKERVLVRQYMWEKSHAETIGDMVSIVSLNRDDNSFVVEESWIEKRE